MKKNEELKLKTRKFNKTLLLIVPILIVALFVCAYNFVSIQVEIARKNNEINNIAQQRMEIEYENIALQRYSKDEYKNEYMESIARDKLGYAKADERIYYIMPSN